MEELRKDAPFYESSGGGITLSGGEPMQQADFSAAVLRASKKEGFHTALDTSGFAPWEDYEKVLPFVDLVLYDYKLADSEAHRKYTGVSNETIHENLLRIDDRSLSIEIRIPVIPGINDSRENMEQSACFLVRLKHLSGVVLLPYHGLGRTKYSRVGGTYRLENLVAPSRERMEEIAAWLTERGLVMRTR